MNVTLSFDIGSTNYHQPLTLTWRKSSAGCWEWHLRKDAADQRDDSYLLSGLSDENLLNMAEAVRERRRMAGLEGAK